MKHLGDITQISGYTAPIVDCIIGGSPCQDLSVAGKRAGLDGERSGLYMEQIRIVKEMRVKDERRGNTGVDIRPRYMVWENVPGAFSSNKGEDFRIVLEELAKIADKDAVIPMPDKGKWTTCGCIMGSGWSIAWRVLDAQFWGVPQRRRRIALVADFGGQSASEILFVCKSLSRHTDESESKRKETPTDASRGTGADNRLGADQYNAVILGNTVSTLGVNCGMSHGRQCNLEPQVAYSTLQDQTLFQPIIALDRASYNQGKNAPFDFEISDKGVNSPLVAKGPGAVCYTIDEKCANAGDNQMATAYSVENHPNDSRVGINKDGKVQALTSRMGTGGGNVPMVMQCFSKSKRAQSATDNETWVKSETANTLNAFDVGDVRTTEAVVYVDTSHADDVIRLDTTVAPLQARDFKGGKLVATRYIVRRLTPLECERLQGYPDGWTDIGEWTDSNGKKRQTSDAARYKALGNSIALPPWKWVLKRLCACYERDATMASLFDGIGGFPYLWEQLNGKGTCLWASEIEEFPIAVTKVRIGE